MTQSIRDAAQALLDVCNGYGCTRETEIEARKDALRDALSAPQTTADERVAELMRMVDECGKRLQEWHEFRLKADRLKYDAARKAVEQSARALLSASQEDADRLRALLFSAWARMDRARNILTDNNPRPSCNWGMLDTSEDRAFMSAKEPK